MAPLSQKNHLVFDNLARNRIVALRSAELFTENLKMARRAPLSAPQRLKAVFVFSCLGVLLALLSFKIWSDNQDTQLAAQYSTDRKELVNQILNLESATTDRMVEDYAVWTDLQQFVRAPNDSWATESVDTVLTGYNLAALWILDESGRVVHTANTPKGPGPLWKHQSGSKFLPRQKGIKKTFFLSGGEVRELRAIRYSHAESGALLPGFFVTESALHQERIEHISTLLGSKVELTTVAPNKASSSGSISDFAMHYPLEGVDGVPVAWLRIRTQSPMLIRLRERSLQSLTLFGSALLLLAVVMVLALNKVVAIPKDQLSKALESNDPSLLMQHAGSHPELEGVAGLIGARAEKDQLKELNLELEGKVLRRTADMASAAELMVERLIQITESNPSVLNSRQQSLLQHVDSLCGALGFDDERTATAHRGAILSFLDGQNPRLTDKVHLSESTLAGKALAVARHCDKLWIDTHANPRVEACVVAIASFYVDKRQSGHSKSRAIEMMREESGSNLDSKLVATFIRVLEEDNSSNALENSA